MPRQQPNSPRPQQAPLTKGQKWGCGVVAVIALSLMSQACQAVFGDDGSKPKTTPSPAATAASSPTPTSPTSSPTPTTTADENAHEDDDGEIRDRRPSKKRKSTPPPTPEFEPEPEPEVAYYGSCAAARAAGAAPLHRGEPGYRSGLDRDGDGIACDT